MWLNLFNITSYLPTYLLVIFRISSFLLALPFLMKRVLPPRIIIMLSVVLSFVVMPMIKPVVMQDLFSLPMLILALQQVIIGLLAGFVFAIIFEVFVMGAQVISLQTGLGFATLVVPQSNPVNMVSQVYWIAVILIFFQLNGHLLLMKCLINSFHALPLTKTHVAQVQMATVIKFSKVIFSGAVSIALPAIIALLTVNLTFAVMTRSAPQLNIFTIGFPVTLLFGLLIIYLTVGNMLAHSSNFFQQGFDLVRYIFGESS